MSSADGDAGQIVGARHRQIAIPRFVAATGTARRLPTIGHDDAESRSDPLVHPWSALNLLVAAAVAAVTLAGGTTPILALLFDAPARSVLDPRLVAVVKAQAALANPCIVALCALVLALVWTTLARGGRWALWALAGTLLPLQVCGFASDRFLGNRNLAANAVSSALLVAGLALAGVGLRHRRLGCGDPSRKGRTGEHLRLPDR